ncbi:uncharacterized protein SCHCODRAFT_02673037 [Schizophyllum commune H4-8]|uniref:uncharacterized protein n=1 Tax=Schizophyllum commune (strain H4-8 / FGSC 9210) TaxID=578458 RepID=UPI00215F075A|nr:uncharacterized protein SCHCODRAFT_02673037 [Schizophyllum commune H4-8]KAI5885982.1 hypothetical protein SCHCODRAFT_02673037 [Schizophyllum commune H4-8]
MPFALNTASTHPPPSYPLPNTPHVQPIPISYPRRPPISHHPPKSASPSLDPVMESGAHEEGTQVRRRRTLPSVRSPSLRASASGSIASVARGDSLRRGEGDAATKEGESTLKREGSQKREREPDSGTQSDREERRVLRKQRRPSTANIKS